MAQGHKTGGRQQGTPNKFTRAFRDAVQICFSTIGGDEAFAAWARENPGEFYKIAARLIPTEITAQGGSSLTIIIDRLQDMETIPTGAIIDQAGCAEIVAPLTGDAHHLLT